MSMRLTYYPRGLLTFLLNFQCLLTSALENTGFDLYYLPIVSYSRLFYRFKRNYKSCLKITS